MEYLLFVAYLVIFAWLVTKVKFFTSTGLSKPQLIIIFLLKIMAGIFYGWIGLYYGGLAQMQDTWRFHSESIVEYNLLYTNPSEYFTNLFVNSYETNGVKSLFGSSDSYWNDLKGNAFIKILSLFNILSFGNYYVNVIFYSFVTLFGTVAIYKIMINVFAKKKTEILIATFLVPSFIYWTSGLHKEGLIFSGISMIIYIEHFNYPTKRNVVLKTILLLLGMLLVFILRNFVLVLIIPALLAWVISIRWPRKTHIIFTSIYLIFGILFFTLRYINPHLDFPQAVVNKQEDFLKLKGGNSSIPIKKLQPTVLSFIANTPQAFNLSTIRPYPTDVKHILSLAAAVEINMLLLLFILFLFFREKESHHDSILYFCLFFSISLLLAIGFSVNNLGAIVRYRSIIMPLLVIPIVAQIDWKRLLKLYMPNMIKKDNV